MKKAFLFILIILYAAGYAEAPTYSPVASFTYSNADSTSCAGVPAHFHFINQSTPGVPQYGISQSQWNFGDGTSVTVTGAGDVDHTYTAAGTYLVTLIVRDTTGTDTLTKIITINSFTLNYSKEFLPASRFVFPSCDQTMVYYKTSAYPVTGKTSYKWTIHDGTLYSHSTLTDSSILVYYNVPTTTITTLTATNASGNTCFINDTVVVTPGAPIAPSAGAFTLTANRQCTSNDGWVHYYYDSGTPAYDGDDSLVLSLQPNGNDIGTLGDGAFSVSTIATPGAGSNTGILITNPLIDNQSGFWVMNRYWQVTPTRQPATPVGVRFYFNSQDVADVNGSYPSHNLDIRKLIFYKTHGGNPDPTTNLAGAQYITSLTYSSSLSDTTHWTDFDDYFISRVDKHMAEFRVASFSGGGGGATGNGQALPVQLTSFTANNNGDKVSLQWTTAQEINVSKYNVQVSIDGRKFSTLGTVVAHGKTSPDVYSFTYNETQRAQAYYRLQIVEKNGMVSGSNVVFVSFAKANNIVLYPNPAKNAAQIKASGFNNKQITAGIYNAAGAKVSTQNLFFTAGIATLNTSALSSGHYTVTLHDELSVTHIPLVIAK